MVVITAPANKAFLAMVKPVRISTNVSSNPVIRSVVNSFWLPVEFRRKAQIMNKNLEFTFFNYSCKFFPSINIFRSLSYLSWNNWSTTLACPTNTPPPHKHSHTKIKNKHTNLDAKLSNVKNFEFRPIFPFFHHFKYGHLVT